MARVELGWDGDEPDLQQKLLEALGTDVMLYEVPDRPGAFTFEIVTEQSAYDLRRTLEDAGIDAVLSIS